VGDLWKLIDGVQVWSLEWRRNLFVWENVILEDLFGVLEERGPTEGDDMWWWNAEDRGGFTVKSAYNLVYDLMATTTHLTSSEEVVFGSIWHSPAPSNVVAFSWKLLLDRIPTKINLARRNVLPTDESLLCSLCGSGEETSSHIFLHCEVMLRVWEKVFRWLNFNFLIPPNLCAFYMLECGG